MGCSSQQGTVACKDSAGYQDGSVEDGFKAALLLLQGAGPGWPVKVQQDEQRGRFLVATEHISEGQVVLSAPAFLTQLLPSHRKRVCAGCLCSARARLSPDLACPGCRVFHYCSRACREGHAAGRVYSTGQQGPEQIVSAHGLVTDSQPSTALISIPPAACASPTKAGLHERCSGRAAPHPPPLPHTLLCPVVAQFSSFKLDGDMEAMLLMALEAWARGQDWQVTTGQQQQPAVDAVTSKLTMLSTTDCCSAQSHDTVGAEPSSNHHPEPGLPHFLSLCSHMDQLPARDQAEWRKGAAFLVKAIRKAGGTWPFPVPDEETVVHMCGRILANSFGLWALPPLELTVQDQQQPPDDGTLPTAGLPPTQPSLEHTDTQNLLACSSVCRDQQLQAQQQQQQQQWETGADSSAADSGARQLPSQEVIKRAGSTSHVCGPLVGRQVFLPLSLANHSCDPSCWVDCGEDKQAGQGRGVGAARLVASHPLDPGDEVTISYIDLEAPCSSRRASLLAQYSFLCSCSRCQEELVAGSGKVSWAGSASRGHSSNQGGKHRRQEGKGTVRKGGSKPPGHSPGKGQKGKVGRSGQSNTS